MSRITPFTITTKSGDSLLLRTPEPSDYDSYVAFQHQTATETTHTLQIPGHIRPREELISAWQNALSDSSIESFLGCFSGNTLVGYCGLHPDRKGHPWVRHVARFGMMILKPYWGQGLGKVLLEKLIQHANTMGIIRLEALVRVSNERAVRLYQGFGFTIEGTRQKAALIDGQFVDEYFIAKMIDSPL